MSTYHPNKLMLIDDTGRQTFNHFLLQYIKNHADTSMQIFLSQINKKSGISGKIDGFGKTLLHYAVEYEYYALIKTLIASGCDIYAVDNSGQTPLSICLEKKAMKILYRFAQKVSEIYIDEDIGKKWLRLVLADPKWNKRTSLVLFPKMKVRSGDDLELANILIAENYDLCYAICVRNSVVTKTMIDQGYSIEARDTRGNTALHLAVHYGYVEYVKLLLERGADTDLRDINGDTALHRAVCLGQFESVKLLLEHGANVNAQNKIGRIPLNHSKHFYSTAEHQKILKLLVGYGSKLNLPYKDRNWQMAHALQSGPKKAVEILLNSNGIFFARDPMQRTIVHHLTKNLNAGVFELLYTRNFDVHVRDRNGHTPLHYAARHANEVACNVLLDKGADVNASTVVGTPLLYAIHFMKPGTNNRCIDLLLERGADPQFTSHDGRYTIISALRGKILPEVDKTILGHLALVEILGTPIVEIIRQQIEANLFCESDFKLYKNQLQEMKTESIHGEITLFKLLTEDVRKVAAYMRNEEFLVKIQSLQSNYHSNSYFNERLDKRITDAVQLAKLIEQAEAALYQLLNSTIKFNFYIVCEIVRYLDRQDLVNIINM